MADTVLTELKIHDFDSLAQMSQHESEIGDNDLVFTPDLSCRLPLLTPMWFDHIANDMSWLRADTFSWHSGDVYKAAYEHLSSEYKGLYIVASGDILGEEKTYYRDSSKDTTPDITGKQYFAWVASDGNITYTASTGPNVGDATLSSTGSPSGTITESSSKSDTIGDITITYYLAQDGHKICLPDQESNIVALYESTGVAWYYILDTENKQFKLPRTKWGFTGLRDSVGGYVEPGLPNITAKFRTGSWKTDAVSASTSGAATQTNGGNAKAYEGGTNAYTYVDTAIDANRSSAIYGASDTVQPPATQMYLYFWVGAFDQTATEQTAGLNAEMFNDLNAHKIIEVQNPTAENGYTWYRKYADGWVEQGGYNSTVSGTVNITLPIEMMSSVYDIQTQALIGSAVSDATTVNRNAARAYIRMPLNQTTTGFSFQTSSDMGQIGTYWQVSGMSA